MAKRAKPTYLGCKARMFMKGAPVPGFHACRLKYIGPGQAGAELYSVGWACDPIIVVPQLTHLEITDDIGCVAHAVITTSVDIADISPEAAAITIRISMKCDPRLKHGEYIVDWPDGEERRTC